MDYERALQGIVDRIRERGRQLAPCFAFLDPYGFSLSMDLMREILAFRHSELFVSLMVRYIDRGLRSPPQAGLLDRLFGSPGWRLLAEMPNVPERQGELVALFCDQLGAEFTTHMNMWGSDNRLKYVLLHATNHQEGRKEMKRAMWSVTPDGSFTAFESHSPDQLVLIEPEPDLRPLEDMLWAEFAGREVRMRAVHEWLLGQVWREPHLHKILRQYRDQGIVTFTDYPDRFGLSDSKNPLAHFPVERPR